MTQWKQGNKGTRKNETMETRKNERNDPFLHFSMNT